MRAWLVLAALGLAACDSPAAPSKETVPNPDSPSLDAANLLHHLGVLADDSMAGRWAGSAEERQAAAYLRHQFTRYGLEPGAPRYLQQFPLPYGGESQNVLAVLPGSGLLATQWVVVGAHYDAQGSIQVSPDSVLVKNGADDNASGTALLLEVARVLTVRVAAGDMAGQDRRSVLFGAFGGEEPGLIGSRYFCAQPTVDMDSVAAMLNFDMVGRYAQNGLWTIGLSTSDAWPAMLDQAGVGQLVNHGDDSSLLAASDQNCFLGWWLPVMFLHTGLHAEYHTPYDDVALVDPDGMVEVGTLATSLVTQLALRPDRPTRTLRTTPLSGH